MKVAGLLVFLLFPVLTFAQENPPVKPITWEKEGLQSYNYIRQKLDLSEPSKGAIKSKAPKRAAKSEAPESKMPREKDVREFCYRIYLVSLDDYKTIIDNDLRLDDEYQFLFIDAIGHSKNMDIDSDFPDDFWDKCKLHIYREAMKNAQL